MIPELLVCGNIARDLIFGNERYGGSVPAIAVNAARLGVSTGLLSGIGKDIFSEQYREYLIQNGISMELVESNLDKLPEFIVSSPSLGIGVEWIDNGSHQAMETMRVDIRAACKYSVVHLVSCPPGLASRLAETGIFNLSYEPGPYIHDNSAYLDFAVVDKSRMIFFNEEEYQSAVEISGLKHPRDFVAGSNRILIITRGERGSDVYLDTTDGFKKEHVDAIKTEIPVVDVTGAGDCYKAGFLAGYIRGRSLRDCAIIGSYMGAACLTQEGGILPENKIAEIRVIGQI